MSDPKPHWTTTPPTEPGWYWYRRDDFAAQPTLSHMLADGEWVLINTGGEWWSEKMQEPLT